METQCFLWGGNWVFCAESAGRVLTGPAFVCRRRVLFCCRTCRICPQPSGPYYDQLPSKLCRQCESVAHICRSGVDSVRILLYLNLRTLHAVCLLVQTRCSRSSLTLLSCCCNDGSVTRTVASLTADQSQSFIFPVLGLALSSVTIIFIVTIFRDLLLLPAQFCSEIILHGAESFLRS
jgi:hypothetical protein